MKKSLLFIFLSGAFGINAQSNVITLNLSSPTNPTKMIVNEDKGNWVETYSSDFSWIEFDLFGVTHLRSGMGWGSSYWDGFTYCTSGDNTNYSSSSSSNGWIANQWGCMPGGGIKTDDFGYVLKDENGKVEVEKGNPYLIAYWGYFGDTVEEPCLEVMFMDGESYQPVGVYIANHPWPYYGNMNGDGFAKPFTKEGDMFKLTIHGKDENGEYTGISVDHILAEFKDGELIQSADWEWVDLSSLGAVASLYFTMESTDADPMFGPNTAVYFCMDKLQVKPVDVNALPTVPAALTGTAEEKTINISWIASEAAQGIKGYNVYLNGELNAFVENATEYLFENLTPETVYNIDVQAVASDNSLSDKASVVLTTKTVVMVGLNETEKETSVTYNKNSQKIIIITNNAGEISIYSVNGKNVLSKFIEAGTEEINISDISTGMYIVRFGNMSQSIIR